MPKRPLCILLLCALAGSAAAGELTPVFYVESRTNTSSGPASVPPNPPFPLFPTVKPINEVSQIGEFQAGVVVEGGPFATGDTFTASVMVNTGATQITAYDFEVLYDPSLLAVQAIEGGSSAFGAPSSSSIDNEAGSALLNDFIVGNEPTREFEVAVVTFEVLSDAQDTIIDLNVRDAGDTNFNPIELTTVSETVFLDTPLTPRPTRTFTPTFTPRPTSTFTPTPTPTFTPTSTPTPTPGRALTLEDLDAQQGRVTIEAPPGYAKGRVRFGDIPEGEGLAIDLFPGDGVLLVFSDRIYMPEAARIAARLRASAPVPAVAVIGLNSPIDGQLAYSNMSGQVLPTGSYGDIKLVYQPRSEYTQIGVQAVNPDDSPQSVTVWVDGVRIEPFPEALEGDPIAMEVDGTYDRGVGGLLSNVNGDDGLVAPFFQTFDDVAVRLAIRPGQRAANVGTELRDPLGGSATLVARVDAKRETSGGGTMALVLTDGLRNVGAFLHADGLGVREMRTVFVGGDFSGGAGRPAMVIVQIGGPGADAALVVDDLAVLSHR